MSVQTIFMSDAQCTFPQDNIMRLNLSYPYNSQNQEVALASLLIYFSWPNIRATQYQNNTVSYIQNGIEHPITFPDGFYAISDLNQYIHDVMVQNGDYLVDDQGNNQFYLNFQENLTYYCTTLTATPTPTTLPTNWTNPGNMALTGLSPQLKITNANWGQLIGFTVGSYPSSASSTAYMVNSNEVAQISPVSAVNVWCNMVSDAKLSVFPQVLYTFSPNVNYSQQININVQQPLWKRVVDNSYNNIDIGFWDQQGRPVYLLDRSIVVALVVRNIQ